MERQTSWGWLVALYMFLGGTGAGIYTAGFILGFTGSIKQLAFTGMVLGPVLVIVGLICLLIEAGSPLQSYRLFKGLPTSWMSRGGLIQILFIIFGFGYALPGYRFSGWLNSGTGLILGSIALVLALALATYHGIVLTESRRIPLWSSSVMPLLSFFTALCAGLGLLLLISTGYDGVQVAMTKIILGISGIAFVIGELIAIWSVVVTSSNSIYIQSVRRIRTPMIMATICLLLALALLVVMMIEGANIFVFSLPISGVLLLVGSFITRYSILKGGYYIPLRVPGV
ncbi:NrfD/PsrC family molybdoenzyme membrane anchor subunit [Chloroflexota bacterium]